MLDEFSGKLATEDDAVLSTLVGISVYHWLSHCGCGAAGLNAITGGAGVDGVAVDDACASSEMAGGTVEQIGTWLCRLVLTGGLLMKIFP